MKDNRQVERPIKIEVDVKDICTLISMVNSIPTGMGEKKLFGKKDCECLQSKVEFTKAHIISVLDRAFGAKSGIHPTLVPYLMDTKAMVKHLRSLK